jgi:hypothetical protein
MVPVALVAVVMPVAFVLIMVFVTATQAEK